MIEKHNKNTQGGGGVVSSWVAEQQFWWPAESELGTKSAKIQEKGLYISHFPG